MNLQLLGQLLVNGLGIGATYAVLAAGFALVYNVTGILHLSHGAIFGVAGYTIWFVAIELGYPFLAAILAAVVAASFLGVLNYRLVYRPLRRRGASNLAFFIGSLSFAILIENGLAIATQNVPRFLSRGVAPQIFELSGIIVSVLQIASVAAFVAVLIGYFVILQRTDVGLAIRAVASNPELAHVVGVNTERVYFLTFIISSALVVPAAITVGLTLGITPYFGTLFVMKAISATIIGGIGSFIGPLVGGLMLGVFENGVLIVLPADWQLSVSFGLVLVFMLVRPSGIFGSGPRERALR